MTFPGPWPASGPTQPQGGWPPSYSPPPPPYSAGAPGPQGWWQAPAQPTNPVPPYGWQPPPPAKRSRLKWVAIALIPVLCGGIALGVWGFYHH
jgi:hypothetical protein